jgi:hypothetical protein
MVTTEATGGFENKASEQLKETRSLAVRLHRDADTLELLAGSNRMSRLTQADCRHMAKEHINSIGKLLKRLRDIQHVASPRNSKQSATSIL